MNRRTKAGVLERVFRKLQDKEIIEIQVQILAVDSTIAQVHPDATGAEKRTARKPSGSHQDAGPPTFIWLPQMIGGQLPSH